MNTPIIESGEPYVKEECDRCYATNVKGVRYVRGSRCIFKCEKCGKSNDLGYLEDAHKKQLSGKLGHEKATENRDRFWREHQEKQAMEYKKAVEDQRQDAHEIFNIDYATRKWNF